MTAARFLTRSRLAWINATLLLPVKTATFIGKYDFFHSITLLTLHPNGDTSSNVSLDIRCQIRAVPQMTHHFNILRALIVVIQNGPYYLTVFPDFFEKCPAAKYAMPYLFQPYKEALYKLQYSKIGVLSL